MIRFSARKLTLAYKRSIMGTQKHGEAATYTPLSALGDTPMEEDDPKVTIKPYFSVQMLRKAKKITIRFSAQKFNFTYERSVMGTQKQGEAATCTPTSALSDTPTEEDPRK